MPIRGDRFTIQHGFGDSRIKWDRSNLFDTQINTNRTNLSFSLRINIRFIYHHQRRDAEVGGGL